MEDTQFEDVVSKFWKPTEIGEALQGEYIGQTETDYGMAPQFLTNDGVYICGNAIVVERMRGIKEGTIVRITYEGEEKSKSGRTFKMFRVQKAKGVEVHAQN